MIVARWASASDGALDLVAGQDVVGVDDAVGVALLGQEALPVRGVVLVDGVARDDGVACTTSVGLGARIRPSRCASSCRDPNVPETWIATAASGRSTEKLATLETTSVGTSPRRNASYSRSRSGTVVEPLMTERRDAPRARRAGRGTARSPASSHRDAARRVARRCGSSCRWSMQAGTCPPAPRSRRPFARGR